LARSRPASRRHAPAIACAIRCRRCAARAGHWLSFAPCQLGSLRAAGSEPGQRLRPQAFFEELLRLVYRLIFLATVEDRRDRGTGERLVFDPKATEAAKARYLAGYSLTWLRERAASAAASTIATPTSGRP
jgi:hypothetical protein